MNRQISNDMLAHAYRHRYSSDAGKFVVEIVIDEQYLVLNYEGLWQREGDA